jgi:hypothetical protein
MIVAFDKNSNWRYLQKLTSIPIFGIFLVLPLLNSRLDPDIHHDGIMYTAALGASNGLIPNRDFFAQYGFGTPYLQGLWMHLTSDSLLSLRIFTALQLALVALLLFFACQKFLSGLLSFLIAFGWIVQLSARIPWASILVTIVSLSVFLLLFSNAHPKTYLTSVASRVFIAGFVSALGVTFRFQNILLFFMIIVAIYLFESDRKILIPLCLGFFMFCTLFVLFAVKIGFLTSMINQTVVWPSKFYSAPALTKSFITDTLWFPAIFFIVTSIVILLSNISRDASPHKLRLTQMFLVFTFTLFSFAALSQTRDGYLSLRNPKILLMDGTSKFVGFLGFWSASACALLFLCIIYKRFFASSSFPFIENKWVWIAFCGFATLPQLYPLHDQVHLWYITPILLLSSVPILSYFLKVRPASQSWITAILTISIMVSLSTDIKDFKKERIQYVNLAMSGLLGERESVSITDSKMRYLERFAKETKVGFDCAHGMFAGAGERFLSDDPMFVNWGPARQAPISSSSSIFVCSETKSQLAKYASIGFIQKKLWNNSDNTFDAFLVRK